MKTKKLKPKSLPNLYVKNSSKETSPRKLQEIKKTVFKLASSQNLAQLKSNLKKIGYDCANVDFRCKSTWLAVEKFLQAKNTKATSLISGIKENWNKQYVNASKATNKRSNSRNSQDLAYSR